MDKYTWSYSSISLFQQCPRKYHRLRVLKDVVEPPQAHLDYGSAVHKAAEDYVCGGIDIPEKYGFIKTPLDAFKILPGEKHCEYEMGLTKDFQPCKFKDPDVWFRGIADLLVIDGDEAKIVDYKTGRSSQYADIKQLELLSLAWSSNIFQMSNELKQDLIFLVARDLIKAEFTDDQQSNAWTKWLPEIERLETAFETDVWNPKPNFTCRKFCAVSGLRTQRKKLLLRRSDYEKQTY
jgi:hypothetical protein